MDHGAKDILDGKQPVAGVKYSVNIKKSLIVSIMVTKEGSASNTDYAFEYWLEGTENDFIGMIGAWIEDLTDTLFYFLIVCVSCLGLMILCCFVFCIRLCMTREKNKIEPNNQEMENH